MKINKTILIFYITQILIISINSTYGQIIEEGKGIGEITLGIKETKIIKLLGENYQRTIQKEYYELEFQEKYLIIGFDFDSLVNYILIKPEINLPTKKGLKVTKDLILNDVKKKYGTGRFCSFTKNDSNMTFCYDYGITFYVSTIYKNDKPLWFWKKIFQLEKEYKKAKITFIEISENELKNSDNTFYEYYEGIYIPKDINDCIAQIDKLWNDSTKLEVKKMSEDEFIGTSHFGIGLWIRNNWNLWRNFRLTVYFNNLEIYHPDDMSSIILKSYYRYLNNQDIKINEQIDYYKNYWKKMKN